MKQKTRNEIDDKYKWDLTKIYLTDEYWYKDYDILKDEINEITKFKGIITSSATNLLNYLNTFYKLDRKIEKLYMYAHLNYDADTTNSKSQEMQGKIEKLISDFSNLDSFANPEMMSCSYSVIEGYIKECKELEEYRHLLEDLYRYKSHILTAKEEEILSMLSLPLNNSSDTFEFLTDSDMKFGNILDEENNLVELTESNYNNFMHSSDRRVRHDAFKRLLGTYGNFKNTIASTFSGNIKSLTSLAKVKNFSSSLNSSLFKDNIDISVYDNLIKTVKDNMSVLYKYYDLKKEVLSLDELHLYDIYLEMVKSLDKEYTFEEAKEIVLKALQPLGDNYINDLKQAFSQKWIDIYNNEGKRTGAYSSGGYDTYPYVLLNYEGKLKDVSTLAHELGHSMHSYYSVKNNTYPNYSYKIFVAEVASTVNELLLNYYLLNNSNDKEEKLYILNSLMELFKGTIYRQTMFAEFEKNMHEKYENGEVLTNELLCCEYYKLNKEYFGSNVVVDDEIKYEWERIPHFYYNFYVYKYAIGLSCACYIVDGILNKKEKALENYLKFLSLGGSDYPANELKLAGIDITSSEVVESAIKMFNDTIEQFKEISK
jgi:oligoendopeptidase F